MKESVKEFQKHYQAGKALSQSIVIDYANKKSIWFNTVSYRDQKFAECDLWVKQAKNLVSKQYGESHHYLTNLTYPDIPQKSDLPDIAKNIVGTTFIHFNSHLRAFEAILREMESKTPKASTIEQVVYELKYISKQHQLLINNIAFHKYESFSLQENIISYVIRKPNQKVTIDELKKITKEKIDDLPKLIANMGFKKNCKKLFFPTLSKKGLYFRNLITENMLQDEHIPLLTYSDLF